jgi:hypothetical protein
VVTACKIKSADYLADPLERLLQDLATKLCRHLCHDGALHETARRIGRRAIRAGHADKVGTDGQQLR